MGWYKCIVSNAYTNQGMYKAGEFYELPATPPAAFFTVDTTAETRRKDDINFFNAERDANQKMHIYDAVEFHEPIQFTKTTTSVTTSPLVLDGNSNGLFQLDGTSNAIVVTLPPSADTDDGLTLTFKRIDSVHTNEVSIDVDGSDSLENIATGGTATDAAALMQGDTISFYLDKDNAFWRVGD